MKVGYQIYINLQLKEIAFEILRYILYSMENYVLVRVSQSHPLHYTQWELKISHTTGHFDVLLIMKRCHWILYYHLKWGDDCLTLEVVKLVNIVTTDDLEPCIARSSTAIVPIMVVNMWAWVWAEVGVVSSQLSLGLSLGEYFEENHRHVTDRLDCTLIPSYQHIT